MFRNKMNPWSHILFEADKGGDGTSGDTGSDTSNENKSVMVTQEKMNSVLAEQKRESKKVVKELTSQLKAQAESSETSAAERKVLEDRIDELNQTVMSTEELAKEKEAKLTSKLNETVDSLTKDSEGWKKRFCDAEITRDIATASVANDAFNAQQLSDLIAHKVTSTLNEDGTIAHTIGEGDNAKSISDHVKAMREDVENYGNLFKSTKTPGTGTSNAEGSGSPDLGKMSVTEIIAHRQKQRNG